MSDNTYFVRAESVHSEWTFLLFAQYSKRCLIKKKKKIVGAYHTYREI